MREVSRRTFCQKSELLKSFKFTLRILMNLFKKFLIFFFKRERSTVISYKTTRSPSIYFHYFRVSRKVKMRKNMHRNNRSHRKCNIFIILYISICKKIEKLHIEIRYKVKYFLLHFSSLNICFTCILKSICDLIAGINTSALLNEIC